MLSINLNQNMQLLNPAVSFLKRCKEFAFILFLFNKQY
jgi:hypothetical protein